MYKLKSQIDSLRQRYPLGTHVELIQMGDDPRPIPSGTMGTVDMVDDIGTVHCTFDNGRILGLISGEDSFRIAPELEQTMELGGLT
jgi:hypothetical protein